MNDVGLIPRAVPSATTVAAFQADAKGAPTSRRQPRQWERRLPRLPPIRFRFALPGNRRRAYTPAQIHPPMNAISNSLVAFALVSTWTASAIDTTNTRLVSDPAPGRNGLAFAYA